MDKQKNATPNNTQQNTAGRNAANNQQRSNAQEQQDRLVQQDEPLKNNDRDVDGNAEQSWSHRNGGQE